MDTGEAERWMLVSVNGDDECESVVDMGMRQWWMLVNVEDGDVWEKIVKMRAVRAA